MRILLDTHCWLWLQTQPERIAPRALGLLEDPENQLFLSAASSWEIAIKWQLGRLPLPEDPDRYVPHRLQQQGVTALPIEHRHVLQVAQLPLHHRDPFDRLLIVQAQLEKMRFLTADPALQEYDDGTFISAR